MVYCTKQDKQRCDDQQQEEEQAAEFPQSESGEEFLCGDIGKRWIEDIDIDESDNRQGERIEDHIRNVVGQCIFVELEHIVRFPFVFISTILYTIMCI